MRNTLYVICIFNRGIYQTYHIRINPDSVSLQISNMVRDAIKPDITMFLHYETIEENGKEIVVVDVQRGTNRPYYLAKKGMRPEGVYDCFYPTNVCIRLRLLFFREQIRQFSKIGGNLPGRCCNR